MVFDEELITKSNALIFQIGILLKQFKADDIKRMISQFNHTEAASVVFDAIALETNGYPGGRTQFYESVKFKKQFLELAEPLIRFLNEEEDKFNLERMKIFASK